MTSEQLETIRERLAKATKGPWVRWKGKDDPRIWSHNGVEMAYLVTTMPDIGYQPYHDSEFITHSPTDIQSLLDEVDRLREALSFYADTSNYVGALVYHPVSPEDFYPIIKDRGKKAREVLG